MGIMPTDIYHSTQSLFSNAFYSSKGVHKTPLIHSDYLSEQIHGNVLLKCENLQTTGSFKIRGATSAMLKLSSSDKVKGVITASSGNHGAATAAAAKALNIPVTIVVPDSISPAKEQKILAANAKLVKVCGNTDEAERLAIQMAKDNQVAYISPYNHADVIAGQATIAHEILNQEHSIDAVLMSVGGGGLISGVGSYLNVASPNTSIVGCWPEHSPAMFECIKAGKVIAIDEKPTLSDGTAGGIEPNAITLPICTQVISNSALVSEEEIINAMTLIHQEHNFIIEGAAGVAVAGLLKKKNDYQGKTVVIVLCGKNIEHSIFEAVVNTGVL